MATIKVVELVSLLSQWAEVRVVTTEKAKHFFEKELITNKGIQVYGDDNEWTKWKRGDSVLHVEVSQHTQHESILRFT